MSTENLLKRNSVDSIPFSLYLFRMPRVMLEGFECSRCGHRWIPREGLESPQTCPKCKSPYWDRPRRNDVATEHRVTCAWKAPELDGKTVEYSLVRGGKTKAGIGRFSAGDMGDGTLQIMITDPYDQSKRIRLTQAEADCIKSHSGQYRFKCIVP